MLYACIVFFAKCIPCLNVKKTPETPETSKTSETCKTHDFQKSEKDEKKKISKGMFSCFSVIDDDFEIIDIPSIYNQGSPEMKTISTQTNSDEKIPDVDVNVDVNVDVGC